MKKYYFISSVLHLIFILMVILLPNGNGDGSGKGEGVGAHEKKSEESKNGSNNQNNKKIIPKSIEVTIVTQPKKGVSVKKPPTKKSIGIKECKGKAWYGGIGIEHDYTTSMITRVAEGYPAFKAGIQAGDVLVNLDRISIIGEPGTYVHFTVKRSDNSYKMYNLVREKICIQ